MPAVFVRREPSRLQPRPVHPQKDPEAEAAFKRALEIDPRYAIAKQNLALLPETRRTGPPKMIGTLDPFKATKVKQEITFVVE